MSSPTTSIPAHAFVPVAFVRLLHDYLDARDLRPSQLPGQCRLRARQEPLDPYPARQFCAQLSGASKLLRDPLLGLHLGQTLKPGYLGALGYVLAASDSLADAMERMQRYHTLVHDTNELRVSATQGHLVIEWPDTEGRYGALFDEMGIAAFVQFYRNLRGSRDAFPRIDFTNPAPADQRPYREYFGGAVCFNQSATRIHVPISYLGLPFRSRDPMLRRLLEQQVGRRLKTRGNSGDLERSVRRQIVRLAHLGMPTLEQVALELRLSTRALRQQLTQRGLCYRGLRHEVFQQLAKRYLARPEISIQQVALLLGYAEQSAFSRAFSAWTGGSPRDFRRRAKLLSE